MKVYLDTNNICHTKYKEGYVEAEHTFFDNVPTYAIECYKFIPNKNFIQCINSTVDTAVTRQYNADDTNIKDLVTFVPDEDAVARTKLFPKWQTGTEYAISYRVQYNELLYKCVQAHTSQTDWTPDVTPALWTQVSVEEYPEWVQPTGAQDAYAKGDKVTHNSLHWTSDVDANVWEPGVYGWTQAE